MRWVWPLTSWSVPIARIVSGLADIGGPRDRVEDLGVDPAVDDLESRDRSAAFALEHGPVVVRDRDREGRLGDLLAEHRPVDVEIRAMRGERVRDARSADG